MTFGISYMNYGVYTDEEVNDFTVLFYKEKRTSSQDAKMNNLIDKAVERYCYLEEEDEKRADEFKKNVKSILLFIIS